MEPLRLGLVSRVLRIRVVGAFPEALGSLVSARFAGFDQMMDLWGLESARQGKLKEEATFVVGNIRVSRPFRSYCSLVLLVLGDSGRRSVEQILAVCQPVDRAVVSGRAGLVGCRWSGFDMEHLFLGAAAGFQAAVSIVGAGQSELVLWPGLEEEELVS